MQLHKIEKSKDQNFWSAGVGADIRLIVHKASGSLLLCYVDHHDKATPSDICSTSTVHARGTICSLLASSRRRSFWTIFSQDKQRGRDGSLLMNLPFSAL